MTATVVARSVHGLEWVCADEITSRLPAAHRLTLSRRAVTFHLPALDSVLFALRTADDVFIEVGHVDEVGTGVDAPALLAKRLGRLDWAARLGALRQLRPLPSLPRFDVVASVEGRHSYNRFAVENAVGPVLAARLPGSYLARTSAGRASGESDLTVRVFLRGSTATAALRLGVRPLHRRAYKQDTGPGTLHPPVAAALARLAEPTGPEVVLDPFCGDGTIAIEAALSYPRARIRAGDIDPARLRNARLNAQRAGVELDFAASDAGSMEITAHSVNAVVTNPPWNLAVDAHGRLAGSLDPFWRRLSDLLTSDGRGCAVTDVALDTPRTLRRMGLQIGLATQVRLAGRVSHLILCGPRGGREPVLPAGLGQWRARAIAAGVVTEEGF